MEVFPKTDTLGSLNGSTVITFDVVCCGLVTFDLVDVEIVGLCFELIRSLRLLFGNEKDVFFPFDFCVLLGLTKIC